MPPICAKHFHFKEARQLKMHTVPSVWPEVHVLSLQHFGGSLGKMMCLMK